MRRFVIALAVAVLATPLLAEDAFLSIGGSTGSFHTDMRIFNPSTTKDIQVTAYLLQTGNQDNSGAQSVTFTVPKRTQLVYNDVLSALFGVGGLGGLRLKSADDFVATQRIYALAADGSTTGQYIGGLDAAGARKKGVMLQIRNNGANGQIGTFRTNAGAVNPNATAANVTWRLYDKNNNLVGAAKQQVMPPLAVIAPTSVVSFAAPCPTPANVPCTAPGSADLTDSWLSYESDQPLFAYVSIVDNADGDGTLIPNYEDTGVAQQQQPSDQGKVFNVTLRAGAIIVDPNPDQALLKNDLVTFKIHSNDVEHGFRLVGPGGAVLTDRTYKPSDGTVSVIVTIPNDGTYAYSCTITTCSPQHNSMYGTFTVGDPGNYDKPGYN